MSLLTSSNTSSNHTKMFLDAFGGNTLVLQEIFPVQLSLKSRQLIETITEAHIKTSPSLHHIKRFKLVCNARVLIAIVTSLMCRLVK